MEPNEPFDQGEEMGEVWCAVGVCWAKLFHANGIISTQSPSPALAIFSFVCTSLHSFLGSTNLHQFVYSFSYVNRFNWIIKNFCLYTADSLSYNVNWGRAADPHTGEAKANKYYILYIYRFFFTQNRDGNNGRIISALVYIILLLNAG